MLFEGCSPVWRRRMLGTSVNEMIKWRRWPMWKNWASKTEELLSLKFIIYWEFHFVQFRSFIRQPEHALVYCQIYVTFPKWEADGELCQRMIGTSREAWEDARTHWKVVEGDEMWMYMYSPEIKQQGQCKGLSPPSPRGGCWELDMFICIQIWRTCSFCVCFL